VVSALLAAWVFYGFKRNLEMTLEQREREFDMMVELPSDQQKRIALGRRSKLIVVEVRGEDRPEDEPMYVVSGRKMNLLQLRKIVAQGAMNDKDQKVLIRGDKLASHGNVANAVAACHEGGVENANIGYEYSHVEEADPER